ncbi:LADA_0G01992g1_1 [Lachancea dasiensis]|uniref:LADA_0G01992g1_1 n=1 Tax=Lachancea dasiensis TaxID=1072105 RepID=A0A1G4JR05_9SACH|nr:LADA_0G01992g1_1 [Lachancea dasiensis]
MTLESDQLSPQKEQEIALKILERAELAQMTRQLKMGLSKVATPKKSSRDNGRPRARTSPVKMDLPLVTLNTSRLSPLKRSRTTGETPTESEGASRRVPAPRQTDSIKTPSTPPRSSQRTRRPSVRLDRDNGTELAVPRTPKAPLDTNDLGADLLMYLATSPYTSAKSGTQHGPQTPSIPTSSSGGHGAIPTTPSQNSHLKAQSSSSAQHFGFKVPSHAVSNSGFHETPSQSSSQFSEIMDSPQASLYMSSSSPRKTKNPPASSSGPNNPTTFNPPTLAVPGTPSRELRSSHLLTTPNFNMGDYVHNLFSPSPRVGSGTGRENKRD